MALLWTILVAGPPASGKSRLSRRLLRSIEGSVRINPDEVRLMLFDDPAPVHDEELVYHTLSALRSLALEHGHSAIVDSTAPRQSTRNFLLSDSARNRQLVVIMDVDRKILEGRARATGRLGPLRAFDSVWQEPYGSMPVFKFRNDDEDQFETSFYLLMEYINHEYVEHSSLLRSIFRLRRTDDGPVRPPRVGHSEGGGGDHEDGHKD